MTADDRPRAAPHAATLRAALERTLGQHFDRPCRIVRLHRRPYAYRTSFAIEEIEATLDDGQRLRLIFKDLSRDALTETTRAAKPAFLHDRLREVSAYRHWLAPARLSTPTFYGAIVDERRAWLFLERVDGVELYQVGELDVWEAVARWLAHLHGRFSDRLTVDSLGMDPDARLLRYDADFYRLWAARARAFASGAKGSRGQRSRHAIDRITRQYEQAVERLTALPETFLHGEFYASNVMVSLDARPTRVCPIDWEMAALGPGLVDLAALTAGSWSETERRSIALAYRSASPSAERLTVDAFLESLDTCRLHLAVQWLGWSPGWIPPAEHAQDWLGEALALTERLGL